MLKITYLSEIVTSTFKVCADSRGVWFASSGCPGRFVLVWYLKDLISATLSLKLSISFL